MINPDLKLEKNFWSRGFRFICGVDEVGRGPLAGPVVAGAIVFPDDHNPIELVRDSKLLSAKQRNTVYTKILNSSLAFGTGIVSCNQIDKLGISRSVQLAMELAITQVENTLGNKVEVLIIDGSNVREIDGYDNQFRIKKGDMLHYTIAAASIIAKVKRDEIMFEYAKQYPEYGFETHVGYGTRKHLEALDKYGACNIHRKSFKPVASRIK